MARLLYDPGLLIQHIPRTGGTFVEDVIAQLKIPCHKMLVRKQLSTVKKHSLLFQYGTKQMERANAIACFVRHPADYYSSVWRYMHECRMISRTRLANLWNRWPWHPFRQAALLYKPDFAEWVDAMTEHEPAWATRLFALYVGPECGEFCDFIGRTETLKADLIELLIRFGCISNPDQIDLIDRAEPANVALVSRVDIPNELRERICREERVLIRRFYGPNTLAKRWYGSCPT